MACPNLLISKIMKAKYYPDSSIFQCKVSQTASWIWKSMTSVREEVGRSIWKKIGDGKSTNIWEDSWIPNNKEGKPTTVKPQNCSLHKVEELITNFRWNRHLIFKTFNGKDAEEILKIPISLAGRADCSYWIASNNGNYSVKSAYKLLSKRENSQQQETRG